MKKIVKRSLLAFVGVTLGLVVAEGVFWQRDDGAFPHLNVYEADDVLGARLQPNSTQRFKLGDNPLSEISVNSDGFRGDEHPAHSPDEIWTFGDSQVFGLGVNDDESFSAVLEKKLNKQVINYGVPTYGPSEVEKLFEEQLNRREAPATAVVTINMVNDLFEENRPNRERHRIWDGWAVRVETKPDDVMAFPGRRWLFSQSHLVYAARRAMHDQDISQSNFVSEGSWQEVVELGTKQEEQKLVIQQKQAASKKEGDARWKAVSAKLKAKAEKVRRLERDHLSIERQEGYLKNANAGDIVDNKFSESSRPIKVTADMLKRSAEYRQRYRKKYEQARSEFAQLRDSARTAAPSVEKMAFPLMDHVLRMKELADEHGTELLVLVLPIDVQVSDSQWKKYGVESVDMTSSLALNEEIRQGVMRMGVRAVNPISALKPKAEESFLLADIHLTPVGHETVAGEIAKSLTKPAPEVVSLQAAIRTRPPSPKEWMGHPTLRDADAGCKIRHVDEWVMLECHAAKIISKPNDRARSAYDKFKGRVRWVGPLLDGQSEVLTVVLHNGSRWETTIERTDGALHASKTPAAPGDKVEKIPIRACRGDKDYYTKISAGAYFAPVRERCTASYPNDCAKQRACDHGSFDTLETCAEGLSHQGDFNVCQ